MRGVSFALTALDVRMVDPAGFDLHLPEWLNTPPAKVPVVRLFGVSRQGASVCVHVHGSWPFFYVELSEEAATALSSTRRSCENRGPCTEAASTSDEIVACAELAAAIEDAAKKLGRPQARVVNLKLERWCSIYGLHLQPLPFLRVEVADSRDVEPLAFALQRGEVKDVGCAQAHEAHLPYLLHFLAEYHLCGAGFVRASGQERASRQSCCAVELDVMVDGLINATEYQELLRRAGPRGEAKALASLRSQMGQPPDRPAPKPVADSRPLAGARTTPGVRAALKRWLQGGEPPGAEATAAASAAAAEMQANWQRAQDAVQDIEDLAGRSSTSSRPVRREASPARYSNPADDPRNCRETFAKFPRPSPPPGQPRILQSVPVKEQEKPAAGSSPAPKEAVPRTSVESDDASWEDLAAFLSLEVLAVSPPGRRQKHDEESRRLAAIGYAWRPHGCLLGGKRMRPRDRHGALVVADTLQEEEWRASMEKQGQPLELRCVKDELDLLNALVELIHSADPDVCLGWELRSRSWGFILARARTLGAEDLRRQLSRVPHDASPLPLPQPTSASAIGPGQDPRTYESEMIAPSDLQLPGRLLLNVWRLLMHITFGAKLRSFAPQEAAKELLGRSFPCFPLGEVDRHWLEGTAQARLALLQHTATLASLSLEVSDALEIFPRAGELSRLFGMDVLSGFTRGTQLRVESLLMRVARAAGFLLLSASQEQVRAQPALECLPLVMEPCSGFYWDPVLVLDFKGMYPSLIVAHNISFDTCLGHFRRTLPGPRCQMGVRTGSWQLGTGGATSAAAFESSVLEEPSSDSPVRVAASGSLFVSPKLRQGLLPLMLAEVLQLRAETKRLAKQSSTSPAMAKRLEHKQFALKYFANVTYGYSSASFSGRMPCSEIADSIVATGRRALEEAANFIEATWPGAKVIYGDTDSVFVQLRGYSLEEAFKAGRDICSQVSAKHPQPVELEFEKVYMPCLCLTKKRYGGMAYAKPPSEGGTASFEAKGLEAIRRDQCRLASNVQYEILTEFFRTKDLSAAKHIFVDHAADLLKGSYDGKHTLTDLSFFREARLGTYRAEAEDGGSATLPPQAIAARSRIAAEGEDAAPEYGERVSFAVALGPVGARLVDRCVPPAALAEAGAKSESPPRLDRWWYVEKALLPSTGRMLHSDLAGLPATLDVGVWLHAVPRPSSSSSSRASGPLGRLLRPICRKCGTVTVGDLCRTCSGPEALNGLRTRFREARTVAEDLCRKCASCAGEHLWRSCAAAEYCATLTRRTAAEAEAEKLRRQLAELSLDERLEEQVLDPMAAEKPQGLLSDSNMVFAVDSDSEPETSKEAGIPPCPGTLCTSSSSAAHPPERCSFGEDVTFTVSSDEEAPAGQAEVAVPVKVEEAPIRPEPDALDRSLPPASASNEGSAGAEAKPSVPLCPGHGEPCREVEVKKEGPNKGRHFFACPRPRDQQCDFFAWADRPLPERRKHPRNDAGREDAPGASEPVTPRRKTKGRASAGANSTPAKRRRTSYNGAEGRLERFLPTPSKRVRERIDRAKEHRLLLVNLEVAARGEITATVLGHTGNVYDVRIGARVVCTCPDFLKAKAACKHLLFVFLRVLRIPDDDPRLWQRALIPRELSELRSRLSNGSELPVEVQAPAAVISACRSAGPVVRQSPGAPCPVCFDPVETLAGASCCAGCGRNLHTECLAQWREATGETLPEGVPASELVTRSTRSCPLCRGSQSSTAEVLQEALAATKAAPGQPLRRHLNLSAVSELHSAPSSLEETYPDTYKWITRKSQSRDGAEKSSG